MIKLFAHRGFWESADLQNSISSLKRAYENKFYGIEFDVWFYENQLVLKHDEPKSKKDLPSFAQYLEYDNDFTYWIDFKNLDLANVEKVFSMTKQDLISAKITPKKYYLAPFITDYEIAKNLVKAARKIFGTEVQFAAVVEHQSELEELIEFLKIEKISYLSISHKLINAELLKKLTNVEVFVWTVNDLERLEELKELGIKNFITDSITPQIYENRTKLSRSQS
jgi:glycerophosphoryl diester phosphodiesterase